LSLQYETIVALLQGLDWLSSLTDPELEGLARGATTVEWEPGEIVFEEGDTGDHCYVLHSGAVKVVRRFADGLRLTLARLGPGNIVGELALFEGDRRSATVEAVEPSIAVCLSARNVMAILRTDADAALGMAQV
jgi:CRP/FNR family cyclic AMP-dependent transcriptional regulator